MSVSCPKEQGTAWFPIIANVVASAQYSREDEDTNHAQEGEGDGGNDHWCCDTLCCIADCQQATQEERDGEYAAEEEDHIAT